MTNEVLLPTPGSRPPARIWNTGPARAAGSLTNKLPHTTALAQGVTVPLSRGVAARRMEAWAVACVCHSVLCAMTAPYPAHTLMPAYERG